MNAKARRIERAIKGKRAPKNDFFINPSFDLFSSRSRDPSSTISIRPMVPSTGRTGEKSGSCICNQSVNCLADQPSNNKSITLGILVLLDVRSNRYAISKIIQSAMIIVVVIRIKIGNIFQSSFCRKQLPSYHTHGIWLKI